MWLCRHGQGCSYWLVSEQGHFDRSVPARGDTERGYIHTRREAVRFGCKVVDNRRGFHQDQRRRLDSSSC